MSQSTITLNEQSAELTRLIDFVPPWRHISNYLVNSADSNDMAVDGSGGSPQSFSYFPPANYDFVANRLTMYMECSSAMSTTVFGNLGTALTHGLEIKAAGVLISTWKDNIDMYVEYFDVDTLANVSNAVADTTMNGRWQFVRDTNASGLFIPNGQSFEIIVNDNLSSLVVLRMKIKGKLVAQALYA
ncbi:MAG: hypothetical protein ACW97P_11680 [Candidatus Hodarchaeales archaeon]|jgi:hypothetical protein